MEFERSNLFCRTIEKEAIQLAQILNTLAVALAILHILRIPINTPYEILSIIKSLELIHYIFNTLVKWH